MGDIVRGVLGGGWSLLVGWILPAGINLLLFSLVVVPDLVRKADPAMQGWALLAGSVVLGLLLAAVQTPLFRVLEGYAGWRPKPRDPWNILVHLLHRRQLRRRRILKGRLDFVELTLASRQRELRESLRRRLAEVSADPLVRRHSDRDLRRASTQIALLRERASRYPVAEDQVVPTRLGNAIRRLEEYGYDRFRLDSQALWVEVYSVAPEVARKQVDQARTTVDFFVGLLYGHLLVAVTAVFAAFDRPVLWFFAAGLVVLAWWWYELAVRSTDDWAAATRALISLSRRQLAATLALKLPSTLEAERKMWASVSRLAQRPFDERSAELDDFRSSG